ncbi:mesogenin-1 [Callorhinchus milii]|uniref:mesogenin-1 n=1 Tax=Callorhinchus milii TaxID=7868 RepID=UPI000457430A|nr:mesogenin-1 [Callorhinchus milii]|eukprot:gi/632958886/ref/XP_007895297.1/ PREDICTED: mesogenin-1 [Callorhinchus milii]
MDNLLQTLMSLEDGLEWNNLEMLTAASWKSEEDKFEPCQVPSSQSPSSSESFYPSPPHLLETPATSLTGYTCTNFSESSLQTWDTDESSSASPKTQKLTKGKMSHKRRMKASEREKLRMRRLANALHMLRSFLPPVYSQRGQPLTKIQTLHCAIRYISELSGLLAQGTQSD